MTIEPENSKYVKMGRETTKTLKRKDVPFVLYKEKRYLNLISYIQMLLVALLMFNRIFMPPRVSIVDYQRQMSNIFPKYNIKNKIKQIIITP
jgi:hypothetical protein